MYQYPDNTNRLIVCFGSVFLASMAYVFVDMAIYGAYSATLIDDAIEELWPSLLNIFFMGVMAIVLTLIPLVYNYSMRNSKVIRRLAFEQRQDFLATNSSWFLLRIATYFFIVGMALAGFTAAEVYFPAENLHETVAEKLGSIAVIVVPLVFGVWFGVKVLNKLNLVAYKWSVSGTSVKRN